MRSLAAALTLLVATMPWHAAIAAPELRFGGPGQADGQFASPTGVACDADGNLFVCDTGNHRIQRFSPAHVFTGAFGTAGNGPGEFQGAEFVAFTPSGELLVGDYANDRVQVFGPDGVFRRAIGAPGDGPGQLRGAFGVAGLADGGVVVGDAGHRRLLRFAADGTPLGEFETPPAPVGLPAGLAVAPGGDVYVADYTGHRILRYRADGTFVMAFGTPGSGPGELQFPVGLAVAGGTLFVADFGNHRVERFALSGAPLGTACNELDGPFGLVADGAGTLYTAEASSGTIAAWQDASTPVRRTTWGALKRGQSASR